MPKYDLKCQTCGQEFNVSASIADKMEKRIPCPECDSRELLSVFKSAPGYLKGGRAKEVDCPNISVCGAACKRAV